MAGEEIGQLLRERRYDLAFDRLLAVYQGKVFGLAFSMLGDRALAEEAAQEVFIRIWKSLPGYRAESGIGTWVYTIARNACLTALRPRPMQPLSLEAEGVRHRAEAAAARSTARDLDIDVPALLAGLPERYRQVLTLYYMEERSYEEVARMLDLPMGTVKTWLHRAKKELAAALSATTTKGVAQ